AERAGRALRGPDEPEAAAQLGSLSAELRTAHRWARGHDLRLAARISLALHPVAVNTLDVEMLDWASSLAAVPAADGVVAAVAHAGAAARLLQGGERVAAAQRARLALDLVAGLGDGGVGAEPGASAVELFVREVLTDAAIYDGR